MNATLQQAGKGRLERLCRRSRHGGGERADRIRIGPGADGIERLEAHFHGQAYQPHRHDTYAIGVTLTGVQTFRYRGEQRYCLPGQCHVLHPDELHDGGAATDAGFGYRIIYIDPRLVQEALGGRALPFVAAPVIDATLVPPGFASDAWDIDADIDDGMRVELAVAVAELLVAASPGGLAMPATPAFGPVSRIRNMIAACPARRYSMDELERVGGLDRWTLARQFRAIFGTSPSRFRTLRQLDHVRWLLNDGISLVEASIVAGFADQSHMSRRFKSAYGLTPAAWVAATSGSVGKQLLPPPCPPR